LTKENAGKSKEDKEW